jgi:2-oxoacid:acceptor oxidoreductase gamma subunit (pyruvate/2-ketoisovalerate family)
MLEIRIHGRGGQGSVAAAEVIAVAAFHEGKHAQAFPNFGVERRGAPVEAYARIDDKPIRLREQIYNPDVVIIQDPTLINTVNVFNGLKKNGIVIINAEKNLWPELKIKKVFCVPITKLAMEILGRPITNTGLLAAFAKITGLIRFESLVLGLKEIFADKPELVEKNIKLMKEVQESLKH